MISGYNQHGDGSHPGIWVIASSHPPCNFFLTPLFHSQQASQVGSQRIRSRCCVALRWISWASLTSQSSTKESIPVACLATVRASSHTCKPPPLSLACKPPSPSHLWAQHALAHSPPASLCLKHVWMDASLRGVCSSINPVAVGNASTLSQIQF